MHGEEEVLWFLGREGLLQYAKLSSEVRLQNWTRIFSGKYPCCVCWICASVCTAKFKSLGHLSEILLYVPVEWMKLQRCDEVIRRVIVKSVRPTVFICFLAWLKWQSWRFPEAAICEYIFGPHCFSEIRVACVTLVSWQLRHASMTTPQEAKWERCLLRRYVLFTDLKIFAIKRYLHIYSVSNIRPT